MILSNNHHSSLRDWSMSLLLLLLLLCFHCCRSNHPRWQHNYRIWPYMQTARKSVMNYSSERDNYALNRCDFSDKIPNTLQLFANPTTDEQRKHVGSKNDSRYKQPPNISVLYRSTKSSLFLFWTLTHYDISWHCAQRSKLMWASLPTQMSDLLTSDAGDSSLCSVCSLAPK